MAIVKTGHSSLEASAGFLPETTFGTAQADSSNFTLFQFVGGSIPAWEPTYDSDSTRKNDGNNTADIDDFYYTSSGVWQTLSLPDFYANSDVLANMLYGVCQNVSEGASSPFVKTYTLNGSVNPDFSSNAGYFFTYLENTPIASESNKLTSCVVDELQIKIGSGNQGRVVCSANIRSGMGFTQTSNPSGTNNPSSVAIPSYYDANAATLTVDSQDLVWNDGVIRVVTTYEWIGNASGNADNYAVTSQSLFVDATVKYDTNSDQLRRSVGNDVNATTLTVGANTGAGYLMATSANTRLLKAEPVYSGSEIIDLNLQLQLVSDHSASEHASIEVADDVDQSW